jgi:predicted aldo/keto reductase-like oxidoreductase
VIKQEVDMKKTDINRRRLLKAGALGFACAPFLGGCASNPKKANEPPVAHPGPEEEDAHIRKHNILGRTGLKVSDISLGGATETPVLRYALDRGVNLYDTGEQYGQGQHERDLGQAFKGVRDQVIVITKHLHGFTRKITKKDFIDRFDASLQRLGSDYVDIAMIHHLADTSVLKNDDLLSGYEELKKAGKYRFFGFSTHDLEVVYEDAFASGLFDVMLMIYNSVQYPKRSEIITRAKELGIGVIAMKTMMGRQQDRIKELVNDRTTFSQAAMKWALTDQGVSSVLISMRTFEHIDEYLLASGKTLTPKDEEVLAKYVAAVDSEYCRIGCTACLENCPGRVAIGDIMRFGMYYENYGEEKKAVQEYAMLDSRQRAHPCLSCTGHCESACPHGLSIRERLVRYDDLLRV